MTTKTKKSEYDLSDFAIDEDLSLLDAAPNLPEPRPAVEAPYVHLAQPGFAWVSLESVMA